MDAHDLDVTDVDAALRVVRALGAHRYVASRMHLVHALVLREIAGEPGAWAQGVLADGAIDASSRDERLWRKCTEAEVTEALALFWAAADEGARARERLADALERLELPLPSLDPFDPEGEEDLHPVLLDVGWELVSLRALDPIRHKGLIDWWGDPVLLESARFEEENAIPPVAHLQELPVLGPRELLFGASGGSLVESLVVWTEGPATYHEYVLAGVRRAAKL
jgi:hypothetical protein